MKKPVLLHNIQVTVFFLTLATALASAFFVLSHNSANVAIIYVLATVFVARHTAGYVPGVVTALLSVVFINYVFTYPYLELNFTLDGYPITFLGMMIIASLTSTLTTNLKEQMRILQEREQMLIEAEKEKMRANLLRAVSHDLRTPLTSIIGITDTYMRQNSQMSEAEKTLLVETISKDAQWLLHMVENLLSVTRINNQTACVSTTLESLEEVVSSALLRFRKRLPDLEIHAQIPEDLVMLPMDATLIEQVLINLLENAARHGCSEQPVNLNVTIKKGQAWFSVRDYGQGLKPEILNSLFDGYAPAASHSSDSHKGMGIGLSICKTIINAHHGQIFAISHPDGAEFTFTLPLGEYTYESEANRSDY